MSEEGIKEPGSLIDEALTQVKATEGMDTDVLVEKILEVKMRMAEQVSDAWSEAEASEEEASAVAAAIEEVKAEAQRLADAREFSVEGNIIGKLAKSPETYLIGQA